MNPVNYYEILEVTPEAPQAEVLRAYQRARATYDPQNPALYSMFTPEEAKELLRMVEEAWQVLGTMGRRRIYDETMGYVTAPSIQPLAPQQPQVAHPFASSSLTPFASHNQLHEMTMATQPALHDEPAAAPRAGHRDDANNEIRSIEHRVPPALPMTFVETAPFTAPHSARTDSTANTKPFRGDPPSGMGRTPFGTYTIDDAIEQEIASATNFDGAFLQKIRLYKNVSIDRISDASRVSRPYLTAIESNDYKSLPAAVFVRGFLVQIARTLGLDETKVAASYMKMFKAGGGK